jgi:hypothetical protein
MATPYFNGNIFGLFRGLYFYAFGGGRPKPPPTNPVYGTGGVALVWGTGGIQQVYGT